MSFRSVVGVAGGVGLLAGVGFAQPKDPAPIPVPVIVPQSAQISDIIPPSDTVPALPTLSPVVPPVKAVAPPTPPVPAAPSGVAEPRRSQGTGTLTASPALASAADALPRMLAEARTAYARLRDYACHYVRQERTSGRLVPEETCELRVRTSPFSVSVKVTGPREFANRETAYISTRYNGTKVRFKETNKLSYSTLPLDDPKVLADTRHVITDVGLAAVLDRVENAVRVEKRAGNPVQVLVSDYVFMGRACQRYEVFAERPHVHRYAYRHVVFVDKETHLPVRYEAYDQPTPGGPAGGELIEAQSFVGMRVNTGLGEQAFQR